MEKSFTHLSLFGLIAAAVCLLNPSHLRAQVSVNDSVSIAYLVNEILLGGGIEAQNITFNGIPADSIMSSQIGSFTVDSSAFPIAEGVVMASDQVGGISGPFINTFPVTNYQNDSDLVAISGGFNMNNCAILEFDFTATSDTFLIDYVFSSREYPSFTCSQYNDAFGIFISGPGISGPFMNNAQNYALIPGTEVPVAINTVNSGAASNSMNFAYCLDANPDFQEHSIFFFDNNPIMENSIAHPGHTHMFTAFAQLITGQTYHFKFAIANSMDTALPSAVMMRKGSVSSGLVLGGLQVYVNTEDVDVAPEGVYVAGTFNYFVPEPMEQVAPNLYSFTAQVPPHVNVTYKFFNGNGPDAAELVPANCSIAGLMPDGSRHLTMPQGSLVMDPVCFGTCDVCAVEILSVSDAKTERLNIYPNPTEGQVQLLPAADGLARVQAFDVQGRMIIDRQAYVNKGNPVALDFPVKGMYKIRMYYTDSAGQAYSGTVVVQ